MTADTIDQLYDKVQSLKVAATQALDSQSADAFEQFEWQLNQFEARIREIQQQMWWSEAEAAISHLQDGDPLTPADIEVIRTFLVSDAERYVALENDFASWREELGRLMNEIAKRLHVLDRASVGDLRGLLKDAIRLVPDIRNYLDEQARIERFHQALNQLDRPTRIMLAHLMREQLGSAQR